MKKCPKCGREYGDDMNFCPICGVELLPSNNKIEVDKEKEDTAIAIKSEVSGVSGDLMAYKSKVSGNAKDKEVKLGKQDVMAVRSKVAGGNIVEGNYVHQSIYVNVLGGTTTYPKREEFYIVYLDESGEERNIRVTNEVEIYRKDKSWDVVVWDGRSEIKLGLRDMGISRREKRVRIWTENGKFYIHDYGMRNGVYVNGERIKGETIISPGDLITISTLNFRIERNSKEVSVKRNSMMFIGKELAKYIPKELLYFVNGKYYVDATGLNSGEVIQAGDKRIVVENAHPRDSIMITRQLISDSDDELILKKVQTILPELHENSRKKKLMKLIDLYNKSEEDIRYLYIKEILKLMEELQ